MEGSLEEGGTHENTTPSGKLSPSFRAVIVVRIKRTIVKDNSKGSISLSQWCYT
jgi:hypothetical protein